MIRRSRALGMWFDLDAATFGGVRPRPLRSRRGVRPNVETEQLERGPGIMRTFVVAASVLVILAGSAVAKTRPERCPGGRFMVKGAPLLRGDPALAHGPVTIVDGRVGIGSACQLAKATIRATRRGTVVQVHWRTCEGMRRAQLKGTIAPGCTEMNGV